jgi:hypothetical protein
VSKIIVDLLMTPPRIGGGDVDIEGNPDVSPPASVLGLSGGEEEGDGSSDELTNTEAFATLEKKRMLKMFVYNAEDDVYIAKVNSVLKLNLVAKFVAIGVSFSSSQQIIPFRERRDGNGFFGIGE